MTDTGKKQFIFNHICHTLILMIVKFLPHVWYVTSKFKPTLAYKHLRNAKNRTWGLSKVQIELHASLR